MLFLLRQLAVAAATAHVIRPVGGPRGAGMFFPGWLTNELAPQLAAATVVDAALHRDKKLGVGVAAVNLAALGYLISTARRSQQVVEDALTEGLGVDYPEQLDAQPTPAELRTPWRQVANPFWSLARPARGVRVESDIAYGPYGRRATLDLHLPDQPVVGAPVLLQVHGGAWTIGHKAQQGVPLMRHLAAKGWICVSINYRLAPRDPWPAQIHDVKRAIAWVHENIASYGGDPGYLAITGGSAGGQLAALAALTPNDPRYQPGFEDADTTIACAVPHYGPYDLAGASGTGASVNIRDRFFGPRIAKTTWEKDPELFEQASPLLQIAPDAPDFFVIHGAADTLVPVSQARNFVAKLKETSENTVVYAELPTTQHAFDIFPSIRSAHVVRAIDRYLHWHWNGYRRSGTPELNDDSAAG